VADKSRLPKVELLPPYLLEGAVSVFGKRYTCGMCSAVFTGFQELAMEYFTLNVTEHLVISMVLNNSDSFISKEMIGL
jgi:hypothetical protein